MGKKYLCIGGPLNGQYFTSEDLNNYQTNGKSLRSQYSDYNASGLHGKEFPSMVRLHDSLVEGKAKPPK